MRKVLTADAGYYIRSRLADFSVAGGKDSSRVLAAPIMYNSIMHNFHIEKIKDDVFLVSELFYREHANIYIVADGASCLVIDPGLGLLDLRKFLKQLGFRKFIVSATHAHYDHIGGLVHFLKKEICLPSSVFINLHEKKLHGLHFLTEEDFNEEARVVFKEKIKLYDLQASTDIQPHVKRELCIGPHIFEIIKTPGHTDDSVVFYDRQNHILITGDTLYDGKLYLDFPNSDLDEYKKSLSLINQLDLDLVLPGHNQVLSGIKAKAIIKKISCSFK